MKVPHPTLKYLSILIFILPRLKSYVFTAIFAGNSSTNNLANLLTMGLMKIRLITRQF